MLGVYIGNGCLILYNVYNYKLVAFFSELNYRNVYMKKLGFKKRKINCKVQKFSDTCYKINIIKIHFSRSVRNIFNHFVSNLPYNEVLTRTADKNGE